MKLRKGPIESRRAWFAVATGVMLAAIMTLPGALTAAPTQAPQNTGEPAISGTARESQTLTTTNGTWSGDQPMTFLYRWVRCGVGGGLPDGSNCHKISWATSKTYVLRSADVGSRLRVRVTATNASGSATVASNPTSIIVARKPASTALPTISGTASEASTLKADPGTWIGEPPITFRFQWLRCNVSGATCREIGNATNDS